ncbi:hypothetical protein K402DRAFT_388468 [Aulographum hederae CBS 113979]|uniref:Uncharacterized protein n=1 Tax=Aulographum hederae CBS 113979 TaxID=1176131 RepID=A0A6G1HFF6_9PEZI|nr:hypothetical protein K402DRAFT_388468 [Aulographum hederae CBS 113979]
MSITKRLQIVTSLPLTHTYTTPTPVSGFLKVISLPNQDPQSQGQLRSAALTLRGTVHTSSSTPPLSLFSIPQIITLPLPTAQYPDHTTDIPFSIPFPTHTSPDPRDTTFAFSPPFTSSGAPIPLPPSFAYQSSNETINSQGKKEEQIDCTISYTLSVTFTDTPWWVEDEILLKYTSISAAMAPNQLPTETIYRPLYLSSQSQPQLMPPSPGRSPRNSLDVGGGARSRSRSRSGSFRDMARIFLSSEPSGGEIAPSAQQPPVMLAIETPKWLALNTQRGGVFPLRVGVAPHSSSTVSFPPQSWSSGGSPPRHSTSGSTPPHQQCDVFLKAFTVTLTTLTQTRTHGKHLSSSLLTSSNPYHRSPDTHTSSHQCVLAHHPQLCIPLHDLHVEGGLLDLAALVPEAFTTTVSDGHVPSFSSPTVARTYTLAVEVVVACGGEIRVVGTGESGVDVDGVVTDSSVAASLPLPAVAVSAADGQVSSGAMDTRDTGFGAPYEDYQQQYQQQNPTPGPHQSGYQQSAYSYPPPSPFQPPAGQAVPMSVPTPPSPQPQLQQTYSPLPPSSYHPPSAYNSSSPYPYQSYPADLSTSPNRAAGAQPTLAEKEKSVAALKALATKGALSREDMKHLSPAEIKKLGRGEWKGLGKELGKDLWKGLNGEGSGKSGSSSGLGLGGSSSSSGLGLGSSSGGGGKYGDGLGLGRLSGKKPKKSKKTKKDEEAEAAADALDAAGSLEGNGGDGGDEGVAEVLGALFGV